MQKNKGVLLLLISCALLLIVSGSLMIIFCPELVTPSKKNQDLVNIYGTTKHFSFSMNHKRYEFKETSNLYLDTYFFDEDEGNNPLNLKMKVDNRTLELINEPDKTITKEFLEKTAKLIYEKNKIKIYQIETQTDKKYYVTWAEFLWNIPDFDLVIQEGIPEKDIYKTTQELDQTIKLASDEKLGGLQDEIQSLDIMNDYHFSAASLFKNKYELRFHKSEKTTTFDQDYIELYYYMTASSKNYIIKYENNGLYSVLDTDIDTTLQFAEQNIYQTLDLNQKYQYKIISKDRKTYLNLCDENGTEITKDDIMNILNSTFQKK